MQREMNSAWSKFGDRLWIMAVLALSSLIVGDAPLLEIFAPIGCLVVLWWVAAELIARLLGRAPDHAPKHRSYPPELLMEYRAARRRLRLFLSLRDEAEVTLAELRRTGPPDAAVTEAIESLDGLHGSLERAATRERLILVSIEAAAWMQRTAPLLELPDQLCRADAAYWVDQIAREHPRGVRIVAELDADPRLPELAVGGRLRGMLGGRLEALAHVQVEVETRAAHRLLEQMDAGDDWEVASELRRRRLKRRVREQRHRHSA